MSVFMSPRFDSLEEYVPGEQPQDKKYIKLNTNESPYPPSPAVISAVNTAEVEKLNLYPDPDCRALTAAIAKRSGVRPENIFVSNGSDDILNFCFMAFCDGKTPAAFPDITYGFYEVYARLYGLDYEKIPLRADFTLNVDDYCGLGRTIVIANPNAQTGIAVSAPEIERIIKSNPGNVVVIDEAYVEFGAESCAPLTAKYKNLLVCRTFSKSHSLAGARLGYAIADAGLIADLNKIKYSTNPYNINRLSQLAGAAAMADDAYYSARCRAIADTREYFKRELRARGFEVTDSAANFVLARTDRISGERLYTELKAAGVLIRHFSDERIADYNRITIGTKEQMDALLSAADAVLEGRK